MFNNPRTLTCLMFENAFYIEFFFKQAEFKECILHYLCTHTHKHSLPHSHIQFNSRGSAVNLLALSVSQQK